MDDSQEVTHRSEPESYGSIIPEPEEKKKREWYSLIRWLEAWALKNVGWRNQRELINQYYVSLRATVKSLIDGPSNPELPEASRNAVLENIMNRFPKNERDYTWANAYEIEQLLIPLYSNEELDFVLNRKLLDAEYYCYPKVYAFFKEALESLDNQRNPTGDDQENPADDQEKQEGSDSSPDDQRPEREVLLSRLIKDLQWRIQLRENRNNYSRATRIRVGFAFMFSVSIFVTVYILSDSFLANYQFVLSIAAGITGATFSMLLNLKRRLAESNYEELKTIYKASYICTRAFIGLGAALIIFFFIKAEMLEGPVLPDLAVIEAEGATGNDNATRGLITGPDTTATGETETDLTPDTTATDPPAPATPPDTTNQTPPAGAENDTSDDAPDPGKERALLIIWCFLAGFSETLVPTLLKKTEEQATG